MMKDIVEILKCIYIPNSLLPSNCFEFIETKKFTFPLGKKLLCIKSKKLARIHRQLSYNQIKTRKYQTYCNEINQVNRSLCQTHENLVGRLEHMDFLLSLLILLLIIVILLLIF